MSDAKDVTFALKVLVNKEKTKVLFAEADSDFADVLLSFLTLPLGRIVKILEKHYGDKAPVIGSLTTLYKGLANLDNVHFWTEGAKLILLNPISSLKAEYIRLKLDISDSQPEYFSCESCKNNDFWSVSMYYDDVSICKKCRQRKMKRRIFEKESQAAVCYDGVFVINTGSFVISDDLQIVSNVTGLLQTINILGITNTDTHRVELMNVTFGLSEIMDLLKASLISPTPLSDIILNKTTRINSATVLTHINSAKVKCEQGTLSNQNDEVETPNPKKIILKVTVQKPMNKLLFAQAEEDFIEFLFSFLIVPLGGVECLLENKASIKNIDNLYRSIADLIDNKYFKTPDTKNKLIKPKLPHGYISKDHILPLTDESLPSFYDEISLFSSVNFPKGQGNYLKGPRTYKVTDDLTVTPFCIASILSTLSGMNIPISDVEELELHIGLEEGLSILKASLTSNSALSNGLMNHILRKPPKQER